MRILHAAAALALLCGSANAQTVVDGTGKEIEPGLLQKVIRLASDKTPDPLTAQFRRLSIGSKEEGSPVCGEMNGRNSLGGYAGFVGFIYYPRIDEISVFTGAFQYEQVRKQQDEHLKEVGCPVH